ncbi:terpenoid synthase [Flagelloscypha sp. PMI_526]|nr:terpenoid synthase [Flagelloscypha sp. PMI_526]
MDPTNDTTEQILEHARSYMLPQTLRNWPWQSKLNPHYRLCQTESLIWLRSFQAFSPKTQAAFDKSDCSLLAAFAFPHASAFDLRSCCDLMHTIFALEDFTDNHPLDQAVSRCEATMDAILNVNKTRPDGEHIIGEIARQFWKRASSHMSRPIVKRFERRWREFVDALIIQAQRHAEGYICTPEEYMCARRDNFGTYQCFALLEQSLQLNLPDEAIDHPLLQSLYKDTTDMLILSNDMCSYRKEVLVNDAEYNTITVLQKHLSLSLDDSLQRLLEHHDCNVESFLNVADKVLKKDGFPSFGPEVDLEVATFVDGIGLWVRGYDEWSFASGRYFGDKGLAIQKHRKVVII